MRTQTGHADRSRRDPREHVEAFIADQVARWRKHERNRYLALRRFFRWLADEA